MTHDDIRAVLDRAVAAPDPPVAIGLAFSMWRFWQKRGHLAEARRRLEAMAAEPWSHDDPRLRAKLMEALGGTCWWQGRDRADGRLLRRRRSHLWLAIGDEAEIANAYYNASFQYRGPRGRRRTGGCRPAIARAHLHRARARPVPQGRRPARRGQRVVGASATTATSGGTRLRRATSPRRRSRSSSEVGDGTMEAWSQSHARHRPPRSGDVAGARAPISHAISHFKAAGDAAGVTLALDDLSAVAVAEGNLRGRPVCVARPEPDRSRPGRGWPATSRTRSRRA